MDFKLNLATRTYVDTAKVNGSVACICFLLFLGLFFNIKAVATNAGALKSAEQEMAIMEQSGRGRVGEKEYQALLTRIGAANAIIARKSYNWLLLLDRLEIVVPDGIAMTSIQPDTGGGVRLTGVGKSFAALRHLVERLEETNYFSDVYLLSNTESKVGTSQKGMSFSISCKVSGK